MKDYATKADLETTAIAAAKAGKELCAANVAEYNRQLLTNTQAATWKIAAKANFDKLDGEKAANLAAKNAADTLFTEKETAATNAATALDTAQKLPANTLAISEATSGLGAVEGARTPATDARTALGTAVGLVNTKKAAIADAQKAVVLA